MEEPYIKSKSKQRPLGLSNRFFYGWIIVAIVFLAEFTTAGMGGSTIALFFIPMGNDLGWPLTMMIGAVTAQSVAAMISAPLIGPLLDRFGARPVMLVGAITGGIGLVAMMRIEAIWQFWALYAFVGALGLNELGRISGPVVVAKWFIRYRGRAMAIATSGTTVGTFVMAPIIGILIESFGWRSSWGILGLLLIITMVPPVYIFMRRQPEDLGLLPDGSQPTELPGENTNSERSQNEPTWTLKQALKTKTLWTLILSMNLVGFAAFSLTLLQIPYFVDQGMSNQNAGYIFTLTWVGFTISRFVWGFLLEKIPVRICLAGAFLARSLGPIILLTIPYPINIPPFLIFYGIFGGSFALLQAIAFANYYGRAFFGSIHGALRPLLALPSVIGPIILAWTYDATGTFDLAFIIAGVLGLMGTVIVTFATPPSEPTRSS